MSLTFRRQILALGASLAALLLPVSVSAPAHAAGIPRSVGDHESYVQDWETYIQATSTTCNLWDHHRTWNWVNAPIASGGGVWVHTKWSRWVVLSTGPCPTP